MKTKLLFAVGVIAAAASCERQEEPASSRPARAATAEVPRSSEPASTKAPTAPARPRCVVPMAEPPAPKAEPASHCPDDPTGNLELPRGHVTFVDAPGRPRVEVELAKTGPARERGLMYRTGMPENAGMLFSWSDEQIRAFWMHNTCTPLDMLFLDASGVIVGALEQVPTLNDDSRMIPCPAAHVLEVNAGWVRSHGVKPGQRVQIEP